MGITTLNYALFSCVVSKISTKSNSETLKASLHFIPQMFGYIHFGRDSDEKEMTSESFIMSRNAGLFVLHFLRLKLPSRYRNFSFLYISVAFSNVSHRLWCHRRRTILIPSERIQDHPNYSVTHVYVVFRLIRTANYSYQK